MVDCGCCGDLVFIMVEYVGCGGVRMGVRWVRKLVRKAYFHHDTFGMFTVILIQYEVLLSS